MKANELRIGNWVLYENEYREIGHIMNDGRLGIVLKGCSRVIQRAYVYDEELQPIPLTEEIFIKCGAVKDEYGLSIQYDEYKNTFNLLSDGSIQWQHDRTPMSNFSHIRHLHEFQNLYYSITGGELKIQL